MWQSARRRVNRETEERKKEEKTQKEADSCEKEERSGRDNRNTHAEAERSLNKVKMLSNVHGLNSAQCCICVRGRH